MGFGGFTLEELSAPTVLLVAVVLIFFGVLVPRPFHKQALADRDARLEEKDLRLAEQSVIIKEQSSQITLLLEGNQTALHVVESLPLEQARGE